MIRSLLWIGSGQGLCQSGITEAPELDITWVPHAAEAALLPAIRFDGLLFEVSDVAEFESVLPSLDRFATRDVMLATLPVALTACTGGLLDLGLGGVLVVESVDRGDGFVSEINAALDAAHEKSTAKPELDSFASPSPDSASPDSTKPDDDEPGACGGAVRVISRSEAMQSVFELVDVAASSPSTVLVTGETGVGKEVIARELHARGAREDEPFVAINCAAFPEALLESELFGHAKGAFTGADRAKEGLFAAAGRGTLFLDEIAETSLPLQAKLLRVLQEREVRPVGETRSRAVDCRIIAATNRVLADEVAQGHFREDLFYRLNVFPIRIPPLRERRRDVLPLARAFVALHGPREGKHGCRLSLATGHLLETYHWPGNVRELENEILRALMLTPTGQLITPASLSPKLADILEPIARGARPDESLREALERVEAWMLRRALANNNGRKARTAHKLGLTREGLYKKLKRLGID
jgi:transcriptional regulator with GAF, ATPase, and Fis domain